MNYLYGDSSPSELKSNFLEFLRDAIEFAVSVLEADDRIKAGRERAAELKAEGDAESLRLATFIGVVSEAIEMAEKGHPESPTARASERMLDLVMDTHSASLRALQQKLADDLAEIDREEAEARTGCVKALETLLLPHDPPDATSVLTLVLVEGGRYVATLSLRAAFGLDWTIDLAIPGGSLWASTVLVSRLNRELQIHAPQLSGWISKEVKVKPLKLERHVVTELVDHGATWTLKLRQEGTNAGFDLTIDPTTNAMGAVRVGPADDASVGAFTPAQEDVAALVDLATKLRAAALELPRQALANASSGGADFFAQPTFVDFVRAMMTMMTPIVLEISRRSLTRDELILRRALGDDRREELFQSKSTLAAKYASLRAPLRALFAPLRLDEANTELSGAAPSVRPVEAEPVRADLPLSEVPLSGPPPPLPPPPPSKSRALPPPNPPPRSEPSHSPPAPVPPPLPPPTVARSQPPPAPATATAAPARSQPPPAPARSQPPPAIPLAPSLPTPGLRSQPPPALRSQPPPAMGRRPLTTPPPSGRVGVPINALGARAKSALPPATPPPRRAVPLEPPPADSAVIEVTEVEDISLADLHGDSPEDVPADLVDEPPQSEMRPSIAGRNEELVAVLKMIAGLARNGKTDEAHAEYEQLFAGESFATLRPEEQRQALRLMVIPKSKPATTDTVLEAHRAALPHIEHLVETLAEAADFELLGVAHVTLGDLDAARSAFAKALAMERARMPQSELVGTLMKRMSEI